MASNITLSAGVRQNLLSLQNTASLMSSTQNRLATGKKVNSALDNPTNFFTSAALQGRAGDLNSILDSMSNGVKTLEAADNGIKAITKTVESMQSTLRQARQDKSFKTESYTLDTATIGTASLKNLTFSGGAVAASTNVALNTATVATTPATLVGSAAVAASYVGGNLTIQTSDLNGGAAVTVAIAANTTAPNVVIAINAALDAAPGGDGGVTASQAGNILTLTDAQGNNITVNGTASVLTGLGYTAGQTSTNGVVAVTGSTKTVDELVTSINANVALTDKVRASNDNGKLRIENLSLTSLTVAGVGTDGEVDGTAGTDSIGGNDVRKNLVKQFNDLRDQLDKLADDASFNGINLLRGDKLKLTFNDTGTSTIDIQAKDSAGTATSINSGTLSISTALNAEFDADSTLDTKLASLSTALGTLRSHASAFGSNLFVVQNRTDFTKSMINTLQTGADNLVLADTNEEAANMLALQTRQQLSTTALSLASQADQAVLRLF